MTPSRMLLLLMSACLVRGQRPSFAGFRPIGFPELQNKTTSNELGNRFGDDGQELPLPLEALGDRDLVERISKLPVDKQPFWYINWKALEEQRRNPQTYQLKPNVFIDPITSNVSAQKTNVLESKFGTSETNPASVSTQAPQSQTQSPTQTTSGVNNKRSNTQY